MPATAIVHTSDLAAADDLSEGDLVRWGPSNATRYGEVYEIETDGEITSKTDGEDETTMEGTEESPAFLIRHYEAGEDEWTETDTYTVHRAGPLEKIDSLPDSVDNSARIILSSDASTPTRELEVSGISTTPTQQMQDAAQRGLDMVDDGMGGDGLQQSTIDRARKIANGDAAASRSWTPARMTWPKSTTGMDLT